MSFEWRTPEQLKELVKEDRPMKIFIMGMPRSGTMCLCFCPYLATSSLTHPRT